VRVLDLFSGIGGFSRGFEAAGWTTAAFCEIDPFAQSILKKHWPGVPIYEDVEKLTADRLAADGIGVDVICGGFPCQDISTVGQRAGLEGDRSGLWSEIARLIRDLRPEYAVMENVSALLFRGLGEVLRDLAEIGYDAEWHCIPASAVGYHHGRDRIWIVAYPEGSRRGSILQESGLLQATIQDSAGSAGPGRAFYAPDAQRMLRQTDPSVLRVADGIPDRIHRIRVLGNAVVPKIPELIARAIDGA
jgi:DNA (cytosine-5)-methyltransferase 1